MSDVVYINNQPYVRETIRIKNMVSDCCTLMAKMLLESAAIRVEQIEPGKAVILMRDPDSELEKAGQLLSTAGMGIIKTRDEVISDKIKLAVIDLIHRMNNVNSIIQKSDYLVEKLGMSYQQLSKIFSRHHTVTLEKYIILNKIERIKELIDQDEFSLTEIAYMMDYSSVAYLSAQFRKYTGYAVSDYKQGLGKKMPINRIGED
jgi:AraC family transcriptional regulator